jgi:hypothetical protein
VPSLWDEEDLKLILAPMGVGEGDLGAILNGGDYSGQFSGFVIVGKALNALQLHFIPSPRTTTTIVLKRIIRSSHRL